MLRGHGIGLLPTTHLVDVDVAPQLASIHSAFAPLLRLSGICSVSPGGVSGSDEEDRRGGGRHSPAVSPMRAAESKLVELTAPVVVPLPRPMSDDEETSLQLFLRRFYAEEAYERDYVALIFKEYKKRKSIEQKRAGDLAVLRGELEHLRQRELPPEVRAALDGVAANECAARKALYGTYTKFLDWIAQTTPQWIAAAQQQEKQRLENEEAKRAAMAAAREALTQELTMGKRLEGSNPAKVPGGTSASANSRGTGVHTTDEPLSYEPTISMEADMKASGESSTELSASELRRKAIRMLEAEEAEVKRRREKQLQLLRVQEEQLREEMALKAHRESKERERCMQEEVQQREKELQQRYNAALEAEFEIQSRLRSREEAEARQREERRAALACVAKEEEQLRCRIQETEKSRKAAEEAAARTAREKQMREVREQEELLRQRIADRTAAAEADRLEREAKARFEAEAVAVRTQQEEALRVAKSHQEKLEKEKQLSYLREQEDAYKRRIREKELAEIEERRRSSEAQRQRDAVTPPWKTETVVPASAQIAPPALGRYADPYQGASLTPMSFYPAAALSSTYLAPPVPSLPPPIGAYQQQHSLPFSNSPILSGMQPSHSEFLGYPALPAYPLAAQPYPLPYPSTVAPGVPLGRPNFPAGMMPVQSSPFAYTGGYPR